MSDFFRATDLYDIKYNGFNTKSSAIVNVQWKYETYFYGKDTFTVSKHISLK